MVDDPIWRHKVEAGLNRDGLRLAPGPWRLAGDRIGVPCVGYLSLAWAGDRVMRRNGMTWDVDRQREKAERAGVVVEEGPLFGGKR